MTLYEQLLDEMDGHPYSNYFSTWCIWEEHQSPALLVFDDGRFNCLSCHKTGNLEYLERCIGRSGKIISQQYSKQHSKQPVVLPKWKRWSDSFGTLQGIADFAHRNLLAYSENQWYFKKRKIDQFIAQGYFGMLEQWAVFPVLDQYKKVVDIVVRNVRGNSTAKYVLSPNQERKLYVPNWERVLKSDTVYITYGLIDAWAFESIGYPCVTGVTGKSLQSCLLKPLNKHWIIVPDKGEEYEARKLKNELGWKGEILLINFPSGVKDPDGIRITLGNMGFSQLISV